MTTGFYYSNKQSKLFLLYSKFKEKISWARKKMHSLVLFHREEIQLYQAYTR